MTTEDFKRKLTAILSADVVGYSRLMGDDEADTVKTLETYKGVMSSLIKQHRGRVVDSPGDNLLAEFGSVVDAVQCAVAIQKELQTRNGDLPENRKMEFRIGINLGDVIEEQDRIYGDGVNVAARLEALADPGGICISKTAFDYIENKLPFGYSFIGEQTVKNIARPIGAYKVLMETRLIDEKAKIKSAVSWRNKSVISFSIMVILVIAGTLYWNIYLYRTSKESASTQPENETVSPNVKETPKTIAVLPFDDLSPEKNQEYFADGLTEEILNFLCQIPGLEIAGKTSSFSFKGTNKKAQEIADELGVEYILEGSVRKAGNAIRITAQLLRGTDGFHLWSKTYDRELSVKEIFSIQKDIANAVTNEMKLTFEIEPAKQLAGTENLNAYDLYLEAKALNNGWQRELALQSIEKAIALDRKFALAWAFKSDIHLGLAAFGPSSRSPLEIDSALRAVKQAIEIDPSLGKAYLQLGTVNVFRGKLIEGEEAYKKGLELTNDVRDYAESGLLTYYMCLGYTKRSHEHTAKLLKNDPFNPDIFANNIMELGEMGNVEEAKKEYERGKLIFGSQWFVGDAFITILRVGSKDVIDNNDLPNVQMGLCWGIIRSNLKSPKEGLTALRTIYDNSMTLSSMEFYAMAEGAAYFGDSKFALDVMEKAFSINASGLWKIWTPMMKETRKTPRFKEFVSKIGLLDSWRRLGWPDLCHPVGDDDFVCD